MNAPAWIRRQLNRPIGERERRAVFTAISVVVIAAALLLAMTSTGVPAARHARPPHQAASNARGAAIGPIPGGALRAARRFLDGYLPFAYGRGPASAVKETTRSFVAALRGGRAQLVPPALRRLHPRLVALSGTRSPGGAIVIRALVKDGEVVEYPIRAQLVARGGRYLVTGLVGG
jgi:hypothetical protein